MPSLSLGLALPTLGLTHLPFGLRYRSPPPWVEASIPQPERTLGGRSEPNPMPTLSLGLALPILGLTHLPFQGAQKYKLIANAH